jgi:hypothetical protein
MSDEQAERLRMTLPRAPDRYAHCPERPAIRRHVAAAPAFSKHGGDGSSSRLCSRRTGRDDKLRASDTAPSLPTDDPGAAIRFAASYTVTALLPPRAGEFKYRIRGEDACADLIVGESELRESRER